MIGRTLSTLALGLTLMTGAFAESVNINSADAATLARNLNGVGEKLSQEIIRYRESNGAFTSIDDLALVRGIGPSVIERNRSQIIIAPPATE